tara:strand:- start:9524 stop:10480 length:957 start_codon:yes stop_codon:yes gene_type:complete
MSFNILRDNLRGPIFSIITPFMNDGEEVDHESLRDYVEFLYKDGAKVFYVMGYNSRFSILSDEEIMQVNETVARKVKSFKDPECVTIVADPLHCSTQKTIEFAKHAETVGADIISLIFREKVYFEEQVYQHYKKVSENCNIGILIHEMPLNNGIPGQPGTIKWPLSLLDRIANLENVIAIKEDAKEDDYTDKVVSLLKDRLAIIVSGDGMNQWSKFAPECQAWLSGVGCFSPKSEIDFYNHYMNGNMKACEHILETVERPFAEIKNTFGWHLGIKSSMESLGIMSRQERLPLMQLPQEDHDKIVEIMKNISSNTEYID